MTKKVRTQAKNITNDCLIVALMLMLPSVALADAPINVDQMLANLREQIPYLTTFVTAFCFLAGFFFMFKAFYALKQYGEMRTMTSAGTDLRGPISSIVVAACLMFTPSIIDIGLTTVYGNASIISYEETGTEWDNLSETIIMIVQFVGGVAFVRGLMIMHKVGTGQQQQVTFAKGLIHLIGGVIALNIVGATHIMFTTLGLE